MQDNPKAGSTVNSDRCLRVVLGDYQRKECLAGVKAGGEVSTG